jgi:hypothetical protein
MEAQSQVCLLLPDLSKMEADFKNKVLVELKLHKAGCAERVSLGNLLSVIQ